MADNVFIDGNKIYLRALEKSDLKNVLKWVNDPDVTYYMVTGQKPSTLQDLEKDYEATAGSGRDIVFAMIDKQTNRHIGNIGLYNIRPVSCITELRIIIGEKNVWGKGVGAEACMLIVKYAFDRLNLNKVFLGVNKDNNGGVKCYVNAGFVEEGVLRDEIYRNGRFYDALRMSILKKEYENNPIYRT
ncbi:MAG: GNAT family N-acetyltransferase [Candidatus Omnitrophica bacterium]|nr:GNAT family N-acetyltransferase [Candidatus Omnitrophota bacterium]